MSGNFNDPDGDALTYTAASSADAFTVSVDGSMVTVSRCRRGGGGRNRHGPGDLSATQMFDVTVAVANAAPVVTMEIDDQQIDDVGGDIFLDVSGNFGDPDGDELSFEAVSSMTVPRSWSASRRSGSPVVERNGHNHGHGLRR